MPKPSPKLSGRRWRSMLLVLSGVLLTCCLASWIGCTRPRPALQRAQTSSGAAEVGEARRSPAERSSASSGGAKRQRDVAGFSDHESVSEVLGYHFFREHVQPRVIEQCGACHVGQRFAFVALRRPDADASASQLNYRRLSNLLSLDFPERSRLLAKIVPEGDPHAIAHRGPRVNSLEDPLYEALFEWAQIEKRARCPDCGLSAPRAWIAYVEQPEVFWMIEREPVRVDRGERQGARIMMQPVDPQTARPRGERFDFLERAEGGFCASGDCDFGRLAVNHAATQMAFECRVPVRGEPWLERAWNICIADIGEDGRARNPRLVLPADERHRGWTATRISPFGVRQGKAPDFYDKHFRLRQRNDRTPVFTPDDHRLVFSSQAPLPGHADSAVMTYHGDVFLEHIVSVDLQGENRRVLYTNEGGTADLPFFLRNGNLAFHTWNLERMDRHMYVQALADGMMELPVLGGRLQGPSMWGTAFESTDGVILGLTGRRRGELENYAPFAFDHTLGIDTTPDPNDVPRGFRMLLPGYLEEIGDYPNGFCRRRGSNDPDRQRNCSLSKLVLDPSYLPDGRALVAYNPERTFIGFGERFALNYARGRSAEERQQRARPYFPKRLGVGTLDRAGRLTTLIENRPGTMSRYPAWVGPRQPPRIQQGSAGAVGVSALKPGEASVLHIADAPLWFSFGTNPNRRGSKLRDLQVLDRIIALRVLRKVLDGGACITDHPYVGMSNIDSGGLHPTALGLVDATGYEQYAVPRDHGGDAFGDVPLQPDRSVRLRLPVGELLLVQGIDREGNVVAQRNRVFALPAGHHIDASVRRDQYYAQCAGCHGTIESKPPIDGALDFEQLPAKLDYKTLAKQRPPVDLSRAELRSLTFRDAVRPLLNARCVQCHQGEQPAGGLSLQQQYSKLGNYPPAGLEAQLAQPAYLSFMRERKKHRSHNFSVTYSWALAKAGATYQQRYRDLIERDAPLAELAPWDSGYQQLFRTDGKTLYYLSGNLRKTVFGRAYGRPSNAARSFLIEVLTGRDSDPKKSYQGAFDHRALLSETEVRTLQAVLDIGFPYMARCQDKTIESGPNRGQPWGEPTARRR